MLLDKLRKNRLKGSTIERFYLDDLGVVVSSLKRRVRSLRTLVLLLVIALTGTGVFAQQNDVAYQLALSKALSKDSEAMAYYKSVQFKPIWVEKSQNAQKRRAALFDALSNSAGHALPRDSYDVAGLETLLKSARTTADLGMLEGKMTKAFLAYVRDISTGVLIPSKVDADIVRKVPKIDGTGFLAALVKSSPRGFFKALAPKSAEYNRLLDEKEKLLRVVAQGGWGPKLRDAKLSPGDSGAGVVALRDRLMSQGYLKRSVTKTFDADMQKAVQRFQADHGLNPDGVAGSGTIAELNVPVEDRLASIVVAMERERWSNFDKGKRHVLVNLADFSAKIINNGRLEFQTRAVVGTNRDGQRSPEFSDEIEHMVVNPTWNVPRSITVKEYLPALKRDPSAHSYLNLISTSGTVVSREGIDFTQFTETNFPFDLKQPPSTRNALGLVKFMFPNKYNIYLHDTPSKSLFARETRAFSHGCIRLADPFDFAYALLSVQSSDPKGTFKAALDTGRETVIPLEKHVPVHLMYRTAVTKPTGGIEFRRDIYGRDAKIFNALVKAGVVIGSIKG